MAVRKRALGTYKRKCLVDHSSHLSEEGEDRPQRSKAQVEEPFLNGSSSLPFSGNRRNEKRNKIQARTHQLGEFTVALSFPLHCNPDDVHKD